MTFGALLTNLDAPQKKHHKQTDTNNQFIRKVHLISHPMPDLQLFFRYAITKIVLRKTFGKLLTNLDAPQKKHHKQTDTNNQFIQKVHLISHPMPDLQFFFRYAITKIVLRKSS